MKPTRKTCLGCAEISHGHAHVCTQCGQHYWRDQAAAEHGTIAVDLGKTGIVCAAIAWFLLTMCSGGEKKLRAASLAKGSPARVFASCGMTVRTRQCVNAGADTFQGSVVSIP